MKHSRFFQNHLKTVCWIALAILSCVGVITAHRAIAIAPPSPAIVQISEPTLSLLSRGQQRFEAGQFAEAAMVWKQASEEFQRQGDQRQQAVSLNYLSLAYQALGQWDEAKQAIAQSLKVLPAPTLSEDWLVAAQARNTQGQLQLSQGDANTALQTWQTAEKFYRQGKDTVGAIGSQVNQAQALQTLGLYRQAQETLEHVHQQLKDQPISTLTVTALRSLGTVWQMTGNLDAAQTALQESLTQARALKQPPQISAALFSLGNVARIADKSDAALLFYGESAVIAPNLLDRLESQTNEFSLLLDKNRWEDARLLWQTIVPTLDTLPPSRTGIYVQVNLAASLIKHQGQWATQGEPPLKAIAPRLAAAVQQARTLQDARAESFALGQLASLYEQTHQWKEAEDLTRQALLIAQQINANDIAYRWQWQLGQIHHQLANRDQAIAHYSEAVTLLQSLRGDLSAMQSDVQFSYREQVEPVYRELVSLLTDSPQPSQHDLQQAREVIEALQTAELENFLRAPCLNPTAKQIDTLDQKAAVLYPVILPDRLSVILSLPGQPLSLYSAPLKQQQVETTIQAFLASQNPIAADEERFRLAQKIYSWLIQPAEAKLQDHKVSTLVFVLDGMLRNAPLAALHDGKQYLIEKYSLAIAPGLQLLNPRSLTEEQRLQVLIGGLTEARQGFAALPGVALESEQIAAKLSAQIVLDKKFTYQTLKDYIEKAPSPLVHLATHGQFSSKLSDTFLLTWDGRITIQDLRQLLQSRSNQRTQPIELLVLSACETAEGDQRSALGLAGLSVRSGARSTLATLWAVNDASTANLMTEFYQAFSQRGISKATALRQAQLHILRDPQFQHPYFWAPFILVGNWL
jgi:CHAT domain-containing protein